MSFGEILHKIRKEEDESLRELSKRVELSHVYITQVEKAERPISKNAFCKFLEAYPKYEHELIQAYLQDVLPESIVTKVLNDTSLILKEGTEQELINYLLYNSTQENRKSALELMILQMEVEARKKGTYNENKEEFEALKRRVEKL